ncbi:hypothetical protein AABM17_2590 [Neisseria musculi]|uniref:Periplasmic/secreted protein n=1 Tax=Neisseria musculi TaxID=1815583 RepID=A0A7H1MD81_9NEIS|nr:hypothetical protein H7A79_2589 [Neisseria musculi]
MQQVSGVPPTESLFGSFGKKQFENVPKNDSVSSIAAAPYFANAAFLPDYRHIFTAKAKTMLKTLLKPVALLTLMLGAALPASAETLHYNVVEFSESASVELLRDTMTVNLRVHEEGRSRETVSGNFVKKLNNVTRKASAAPFKSELLHRSASPRYEYDSKGKRTQTGWEEQAVVQVESKNFEALNKLVAESRSDADLESLTFKVSKQNRQDALDEVSQAALARFKDRAAALAKAMGFRNYKIVRLNFGQIGSRPIDSGTPVMMRAAKAAAVSDEAAAPVPEHTSPGTEEVSITVRGTIQM